MNRILRLSVLSFVICTTLAAGRGAPPTAGESRTAPPSSPAQRELRDAMQQYFESRLRADVGLSDAQLAEVLPRVREIERGRNEAGRQRRTAVRVLTRGMRQGATDEELLSQLARLDRIEQEQRKLEQRVRVEIDEQLSVRQRVRFRFFVERFRRDLQRRVQSLRNGGEPGEGAARRRGGRPPRESGPGGSDPGAGEER